MTEPANGDPMKLPLPVRRSAGQVAKRLALTDGVEGVGVELVQTIRIRPKRIGSALTVESVVAVIVEFSKKSPGRLIDRGGSKNVSPNST